MKLQPQILKKSNTIIAEVIEQHEQIPSNSKVNAALTTGIIGTSLSNKACFEYMA